MAKRKKSSRKSGGRKTIPLRLLEKRAAHLVAVVHRRGGKVAGVDSHRRAKHRKKR